MASFTSPHPISRTRWWAYLVALALFPLLVLASTIFFDASSEPMLSTSTTALLSVTAYQLGLFFLFFGLAWIFSRARPSQLGLAWHGRLGPVWRGLGYSIAFRIVIALVVQAIVILTMPGGGETAGDWLRPEVEALVSYDALQDDPAYLFLNLTVVSFILGGFREELWRAGMLLGLAALFPRYFKDKSGQLKAVALVAVLFGSAHYVQGWGAVLMTSILGFLMGWVIVKHRSIWEAVIAHGFFDATSFLTLYFLVKYYPKLLTA